MSYQAIARKWRPTRFDEIAGQGHVTRTLRNALELDRIHHAFLFTGARGVGKTTAARSLARSLNCQKGPTPEPCGECASCHDMDAGSSPDVIEVDGASNNSVDDVRELRDAVRYLPSRDKYRVYIIDEVHMLSIGAFNALLKTLEEPPDHVVFIFATTEPQKIPDTILSRVQRFDFKRIPAPTVMKRLRLILDAEGIEISDDGLRLIARAGEGSMRDSQSLLDQVIAFGGAGVSVDQVAEILGLVDRSLLFGFLEGLTTSQPELCLDSIAQVYDYGYELSQFTSELLELLRNAALSVLSPGARKHVDAPAEELARLDALCRNIDGETFSRWFQVVLDLHDQVSRASRPRLVLEMGVARLVAIRPLQPVDQLVARLEHMERRLREQGVRPAPPPTREERPAQGGSPRPRGQRSPSSRQSARPSADDEGPARARPDPARPEPPPQAAPAPQRAAPQRPEPQRLEPQHPEPPRAAPPRSSPRRPERQRPPPGPPQPPPHGEPMRGSQAPRPGDRGAPERRPEPPPRGEPVRAQPRPDRASTGWPSMPPQAPPQSQAPAPAPSKTSAPPASSAPAPTATPVSAGSTAGMPEPVPASTPDPVRFERLLRWASEKQRRHFGLAENSAMVGVERGALVLEAPNAAAVNRLEKVAADPMMIRAVCVLFPNATGIRVSLRDDNNGDRLTRRELRAKRLEEHRQHVWAQVKQDPVMVHVCSTFNGALTDVVPLTLPEDLP
jgi:DNA polymerase-3 subunit gamma/tau